VYGHSQTQHLAPIVMSSGGGLAAIEQTLCIVARVLERAGIHGSGVASLPSERTQHYRTGSPRLNQPPPG